MFGLEIGSIAEIVAAITSAAAVLLSILALKSAERANTEVAQMNQASMKREEERDERDRLIDARQSAGTLQVWWVSEIDPNSNGACTQTFNDNAEDAQDNDTEETLDNGGNEKVKRRGFIISNEGQTPAVFYDLTIHFTRFGKPGVMESVDLIVPGRHFYPASDVNIKSFAGERVDGWFKTKDDWMCELDPALTYRTFAQAKHFLVTRLEYRDHVGQRWNWTPKNGLEQVQPQPDADLTHSVNPFDAPSPSTSPSHLHPEGYRRK